MAIEHPLISSLNGVFQRKSNELDIYKWRIFHCHDYPRVPVVPDLPMSQIEDMVVVDNVSEHMLGNVYCK